MPCAAVLGGYSQVSGVLCSAQGRAHDTGAIGALLFRAEMSGYRARVLGQRGTQGVQSTRFGAGLRLRSAGRSGGVQAEQRVLCVHRLGGTDRPHLGHLTLHNGRAQSLCRCGRGWPSPGADVPGMSPVPVQMAGGGPSPGADAEGVSAQSRCRCAGGRAPCLHVQVAALLHRCHPLLADRAGTLIYQHGLHQPRRA